MNRPFLFLMLSTLVLLSSCQKQNDDTASLQQSLSQKPAVAIAPVIDNSESGLGWDLSDELTYTLSSRLVQKAKLSIADPQRTKTQIKKTKVNHNPFGMDLAWMKTAFPGEDFVVFMELIEHRETLNDTRQDREPESSPAQLNLSMRLRIIDVRNPEPLVVLQEIIQDSHFIPRQFTSYNFNQAPWNSEEFSISPVGIAHSLLIKELSSRIEDYVFLSRSKGL